MGIMPSFLMSWFFVCFGFVCNLLPKIGKKSTSLCGSYVITSVGGLGLKHGIAALVPFTFCNGIFTICKNYEKIVYNENGTSQVKQFLPVYATFDHALIDGVQAAKLVAELKKMIETREELEKII